VQNLPVNSEAPLSVLRTFAVKMGIVMGIPSIY